MRYIKTHKIEKIKIENKVYKNGVKSWTKGGLNENMYKVSTS